MIQAALDKLEDIHSYADFVIHAEDFLSERVVKQRSVYHQLVNALTLPPRDKDLIFEL